MSGNLSRIGAAFQLLRPLNLILSAMGVAVGAVLASDLSVLLADSGSTLLLAMLSAMCIAAAANAVNDVYDVAIDRVNRPDRPIPSGRLTQRQGQALWLGTAAIGVGASFFLGMAHVVIAVLSVLIVFLYSYRLKRDGVVGNLVVSGMVSLTLIYGALTTGTIGLAWVGCVAAFLLTLAREIVKDLEDLKGDTENGVSSLPATVGSGFSRSIVVTLLVVTVGLAPIPYTHLSFSGSYLLLVLVASACLLGVLWMCTGKLPEKRDYARSSSLLKVAMAVGMAGLLIA